MKDRIIKYMMIVSIFISVYVITYNGFVGLMQSLREICAIVLICILQLAISLNEKNKVFYIFLQIIICFICFILNIKYIVCLCPFITYYALRNYINKYFIFVINMLLTFITYGYLTIEIIGYNMIILFLLDEVNNNIISTEKLRKLNRNTRYRNFDLVNKINNFDKYVEQSRVVATLKERNYISQKLHDSLGHRITGSLMQLEVTLEMIDKDKELSKKFLKNAMNNLREGMDEIRSFLSNIKPENKVYNFEDIKELLLKFQYETSIKTLFNIKGDTSKIKSKYLEAITLNIKEALTNCAKYSEATKIEVSIYCYNKVIRVEIKDNGIGCKRVNKGLGLRGMEERIEKINGRVNYSCDNGFIINMIIILED